MAAALSLLVTLVVLPLSSPADAVTLVGTAPFNMTMAPCAASCVYSTFTSSSMATLSVRVPNPTETGLQVDFEVWNTGATTLLDSGQVTAAALQGTIASWTQDTARAAGSYQWRARTFDGTNYSPYSSWMFFTVDLTAPAAPTLTSTTFVQNGWGGTAGTSGTFTAHPSSDTTAVAVAVDDAPPTVYPYAGSPSGVGFGYIPKSNGPHTVKVWDRDQSANESTPVVYAFNVGGGAITSPAYGDSVVSTTTLSAAAPAAATAVTFQYQRSTTDTWVSIPTADVKNAGAAITWPVAMSAGVSPNLTWTAASTVAQDGAVSIRAAFTESTGTVYSAVQPISVDRDGSGAGSTTVGPGTLDLLSGSFTLTASDAIVFGLPLDRAAVSRPNNSSWYTTYSVVPSFGPSWALGGQGSDMPTKYVAVKSGGGTTLSVVGVGGSVSTFVGSSGSGPWTGNDAFGGSATVTLATGVYTLVDSVGNTATFTSVSGVTGAFLHTYQNALSDGAVLYYGWEASGTSARLRYMVSPNTGVSSATCLTTPSTAGCRMLELKYATATTATGTTFGDYIGRVSSVVMWATNPSGTTSTSAAVAQYDYDTSGNLRDEWDPRLTTALKTSYSYDTSGRVLTETDPGILPWTFTYGQVGTGPVAGPGMLLTASHPTLTPGTQGTTNGTATTSIVYEVPLSGATAPTAMDATTVAGWGEPAAPTAGTAIFPADQVPASHVGSGLTATSYTRATVSYLGVAGRVVNTALPGNAISTTTFDRYGNTTSTLSADNRALALDQGSTATASLTTLDLIGRTTAERAGQLATWQAYTFDGTQETIEIDPLQISTLQSNVSLTGGDVLPGGTDVALHGVTSYIYDAPPVGAKAKNLPAETDTKVFVSDFGAYSAPLVATTTYDWNTGDVLASHIDPSGVNVAHTTAFNASGGQTSASIGTSSGSDAGTTTTTYYAATGTGTCNGHPEWVGLACQTAPAAAITGAGTNPTQLPTVTTTYNRYGDVAVVTSTANSVTQTTTTGYDADGRVSTVSITGGVGSAVGTVTTNYDTTTGFVTSTTSPSQGAVSTAYDALGRVMTYTDASGAVTSTQYDALDRKTLVTYATTGSITYTYNSTLNPQGLMTSYVDSVAGTFGFGYDADGNVVSETLPGSVSMAQQFNPIDTPTSREWTKTGQSAPLLVDDQVVSPSGTMTESDTSVTGAANAYNTAALPSVSYSLVPSGANIICVRDSYTYNANGSIASAASNPGGIGGSCPTTNGTPVSNTFDSAGRVENSGYTYDALDRSTGTPDGIANAYFTNGVLQMQTLGTQRQQWTLDPLARINTASLQTQTGGTWNQTDLLTFHYGANDSSNPDWIVHSLGSVERDLDGNVGLTVGTAVILSGAVTLELSDLQDNVASQYSVATGTATTRNDDQYGVPLTGGSFPLIGFPISSPDQNLGLCVSCGSDPAGSPSPVMLPDDPSCGTQCQTDSWLFSNTLAAFQTHRNYECVGASSTCSNQTRVRKDGMDWSSDKCSGSPDSPFGYPIWKACERHDFGYRNYKQQGRYNTSTKLKIDEHFLSDGQGQVCAPMNWFNRENCDDIVKDYYDFIRVRGYF